MAVFPAHTVPILRGVVPFAVDRDVLSALAVLLPLGVKDLNQIHIGCDRALVERILLTAAIGLAVVADEFIARAGKAAGIVDRLALGGIVIGNLSVHFIRDAACAVSVGAAVAVKENGVLAIFGLFSMGSLKS